ncbi:MAG: hypothetical protein M5R36_13895 [Deltaproteobacteria bacterium]|nr:hypothetical protein [Deltaproteobacteria bacterium]
MFVDTNPRDGARLKRVLVVERESDDRDVLRRVLTDSGYEVRCASESVRRAQRVSRGRAISCLHDAVREKRRR